MEHIIAKLLQDFEQGKMSRRQLIQSLALSATAASAVAAAPAAAAAGTGFKALSVNHISFDVADFTKIRDFYVDLFATKVRVDPAKPGQCHLICGDTYITPRDARRRQVTNTPRVQHIAIGIQKVSKKVTEDVLKSRGIPFKWDDAGENVEIQDPEGFPLQIVPKDYAAS